MIPESFWRYRLVYRDGEVEEEPITHIQEQSDSAAQAASLFGLSHLRILKNWLQRCEFI